MARIVDPDIEITVSLKGDEEAKRGLDALQAKQQGFAGSNAAMAASADKAGLSFLGMGGRALALAGGLAAVGSAVVSIATQAAQLGGHMVDLSAKTGLSVEQLGRLKYSAELTGATVDQFANAAVQMGKRLAEGDSSAVKAVDRLGLNLAQLRAMNPGAQFEAVSEALTKVASSGDRSAAAMGLFGRAGADLLPAMMENLKATGDEFDRIGGLTTEEAKLLDEMGDTWTRLTTRTEVWGAKATAAVMGFLDRVGELHTKLLEVTPDFIRLMDVGTLGRAAMPSSLADAPKVATNVLQLSQAIRPLNADLEKHAAIEKELTKSIADSNKARSDAEKAMREEAQSAARLMEQTERQRDWYHEATRSIFPTHLEMLDRERAKLDEGTAALVRRAQAEDVLLDKLETRQRVSLATLGPQARGQNAGSDATGFADLAGLGQLFSGGNLAQMLVGAMNGQNPLRGIGSALGSAAGGSIGNALGLSSGSFLGTLLPGVGALMGPLLGGLGNLFGGGEEARVVNPRRDRDIAAAGGLGALNERAAAAGQTLDALLRADTVQEYEAAWNSLNEAIGRHNSLLSEQTSLQAQIDKLTKDLIPTWEQVNEVIERNGLSVDGLGSGIQALKTLDAWQKMTDDIDILNRAGADTGGWLSQMAPKMSSLVQESLKFGTVIPENMRPYIENLRDTGQLLDENGEAITDISHIRWGDALKSQGDLMVESLNKMVDRLAEVTRAIENLTRIHVPPVRVDVEYNDPGFTPSQAAIGGHVTSRGVQYLATGGVAGMFRPRGSDTVPAMLTPGELVVDASSVRSAGGPAEALRRVRGHARGGASVVVQHLIINASSTSGGTEAADAFSAMLRRRGIRMARG